MIACDRNRCKHPAEVRLKFPDLGMIPIMNVCRMHAPDAAKYMENHREALHEFLHLAESITELLTCDTILDAELIKDHLADEVPATDDDIPPIWLEVIKAYHASNDALPRVEDLEAALAKRHNN